MTLTISKSLCLVVITMGLVTGANGAVKAHPQISALSQESLASDSGLPYLAQFPGSRNRPDFNDDFEERREEMEDRRDDIEDFRDDMEDHFDDMDRDDMEDFRDDMEDRFDDRNDRRRDPRW